MFNVYEVKKENGTITGRWFIKCLGDDQFTAEVLFDHLATDWINGHHTTELELIEE